MGSLLDNHLLHGVPVMAFPDYFARALLQPLDIPESVGTAIHLQTSLSAS